MTTEENTDGGSGEGKRVALKAKLDLKASEELVGELMAIRGSAVTLDGSGVELFGAHALQTLLIAQNSWQSDGQKFAVEGLSEAAKEHLALMGFDQTVFEGERTTS